MHIYLNGRVIPRAEASLPIDDRGFMFGDGVYEVCRILDGRPFELERHTDRLARGLRELEIPVPDEAHPARLREVTARLLDLNGHRAGEATVYLEITRGAAVRTHHFPPAGTPPTVYAFTTQLSPMDTLRERGAAVITRPDIRWLRCDIKSIQLLPNVLAKQAAVAAGCAETVLVRDGIVTEASHSNLFAVVGGTLRTHPANHLILPGITRALVIELALALGIPVNETPVTAAELPRVDELFLTSTTSDVLPVVRCDGVVIGDGTPGPVARRLQAAMVERLAAGG